MPGIVVRADDAHRDTNERRTEELTVALDRLSARLVGMVDVTAGEYRERYGVWTFADAWDGIMAEAREARALLVGGA
jgi:hypothetical protein